MSSFRLHLLIILSTHWVFILGFEYILNYDRLELAYVDKSYANESYFLYGKCNKTSKCLTVRFNLLKAIDGNDLKFTSSAHQLVSNRYVPLGYSFNFNVCYYWKHSPHGTTEHLARYGNLEGCDIKTGHYYLNNYTVDESNFPKFAPLGGYMFRFDVRWNSNKPLLRFEWYVRSEFKLNRGRTG